MKRLRVCDECDEFFLGGGNSLGQFSLHSVQVVTDPADK